MYDGTMMALHYGVNEILMCYRIALFIKVST